MALAFCYKENKPCVRWVDRYFKDCLCSLRDEFSFGFGIVSLVCWGVAEVPQIITNFRTKSSHGVSLAFLMTWIAGDIFNLIGCVLEPATLYTASTVVLVLQSLYYDYFLQWKKQRRTVHSPVEPDEEVKEPLKPKPADTGIPIPAPISSPRRDYYYTSARSLAGSCTPPFRSYLRAARSGPSALALSDHSSSDEETTPQVPSKKSATRPKPIPRSAGYGAFLAASVTLPHRGESLMRAYVGFTGRKLLVQEGVSEHSAFGQLLGWIMAAIYMGGRVPQIWLNIKRGSVEGLNPLMFVFALIANVTYVLSILVRTTEWDEIKANLPWLLDAAVCVVLDFFIISQYIYYRFFRKSTEFDLEDTQGGYAEIDKD
uniref:PQ-loop repeat family protein / transmembrane family protein n=1 Tax=Kalanchoe fedtschenkoi TaxID=63787 RepID=A0A7N0ZZS9_KALFE